MGVCLTMSAAPTVSLLHRCLAIKADVALAAFVWTLAFSACNDVLLLPWEAPAAAACLAWLMSVIHARQETERLPSPITAIPAVGLVVLTYAGLSSYLLPFFFPAFLFHFATRFFRNPRLRAFGNLGAVSMACAAPAAGYSFEAAPFSLPQNPAVWILAGMLWVQSHAHRSTEPLGRTAHLCCTAALLALCIALAVEGDSTQQALAVTLSATLVLNELFAYAVQRFRPALLPLAASPLSSALPAAVIYLLLGTPSLV